MTLLLTRPFTDEIVIRDAADSWALNHERFLREIRWRQGNRFPTATLSLVNEIEAHDAGDVCHVCAGLVTWTDHLPPLEAGGPVRCFASVELLPGMGMITTAEPLRPGERRVGDAIVYSAEWLSGPEAV